MDGLRNWRSKAADKINPDFWSSSDEIRLFWTILRRGPRGYRLSEYLYAVEQHRSKMRAQGAINGDQRADNQKPGKHASKRTAQPHGC
jgi:hypothetical protein